MILIEEGAFSSGVAVGFGVEVGKRVAVGRMGWKGVGEGKYFCPALRRRSEIGTTVE